MSTGMGPADSSCFHVSVAFEMSGVICVIAGPESMDSIFVVNAWSTSSI